MRLVIIAITLALIVSSSALAVQKSNRGQCRRLEKQLSQHAVSVQRAEHQGNALWARATLAQMNRLDQRREKLCPDLYPASAAARAMAELQALLKMAAKGAVSFFTMGAM
ncbi:MAG: hypothetical protein ACI8W3_002668 [Myxococcota bacterium]|jgi:hypothetical protein